MTELASVHAQATPGYRRLLERAGQIIRRGGLVAFPTETVYGLGANGLDPVAVQRIFAAKGRPQDNPLILHVASVRAIEDLVLEFPPAAGCLAAAFWPGPLTLVLRRRPVVPEAVSAGLPTVAVRIPAHRVALDLIEAAGVPIAAPSANRSGKPSPTRAEHVLADLDGRVEMILDAGPTSVGLESTVVDLTTAVPSLLRPGGVTIEQLREVLPNLGLVSGGIADQGRPVAPGMKYRHYAPHAPLTVVIGPPAPVKVFLRGRMAEAVEAGLRLAVLAHSDTLAGLGGPGTLLDLGPRSSPEIAARRLFSFLRDCDKQRVDEILAEGGREDGLGLAIMNRLGKAAGGKIIRVGEGMTCTAE